MIKTPCFQVNNVAYLPLLYLLYQFAFSTECIPSKPFYSESSTAEDALLYPGPDGTVGSPVSVWIFSVLLSQDVFSSVDFCTNPYQVSIHIIS